MQAVSFNVLTDFSAAAAGRGLQDREWCNSVDLVSRKRRIGFCYKNPKRTRGIVACVGGGGGGGTGGESPSRSSGSVSGGDSGTSSLFSWTQTYALLKQKMEVAAKFEVSYSSIFV